MELLPDNDHSVMRPRVGIFCGLPVFEQSIVKLYGYFAGHVDSCGTFPLASISDSTATNMDVLLGMVTTGDEDALGWRFRYYHRDSRDPDDKLDRKVFYAASKPASPLTDGDIAAFTETFTSLMNVTAPPVLVRFRDGTSPVEAFQYIAAQPTSHHYA